MNIQKSKLCLTILFLIIILISFKVNGQIMVSGNSKIYTGFGRLIVQDDTRIRIYDLNGIQIGDDLFSGVFTKVTLGSYRIFVQETNKLSIYDEAGTKVGSDISVTGFANVYYIGTGILIEESEKNRIRMYDYNGIKIGNDIPYTTTSKICNFSNNRIAIRDSNKIEIYDYFANQIGDDIPIVKDAIIYGGTIPIIIKEPDKIRIYDTNGSLNGLISLAQASTVGLVRNIILVSFSDSLRIFDYNGNPIGNIISVKGKPELNYSLRRIIIRDNNRVRIYTDGAVQMGSDIPLDLSTSTNILSDSNRVVIQEKSKIRIFDDNGIQKGSDIASTITALIEFSYNRVIIWDNSKIVMYDNDGLQVDGFIPYANYRGIVVLSDNVIIQDADKIRIYNFNGEQVGAFIPVIYDAVLRFTIDRIVVQEINKVRIFDYNAVQRSGDLPCSNNSQFYFINNRIIIADKEKIMLYDENGVVLGTKNGVIKGNESNSTNFALYQNYPNPFNSSTIIDYQLEEDARVTICVYNYLGQNIQTLVNKIMMMGKHRIEWNGKNENGISVASGIYFYTIKTKNHIKSKKMVLAK